MFGRDGRTVYINGVAAHLDRDFHREQPRPCDHLRATGQCDECYAFASGGSKYCWNRECGGHASRITCHTHKRLFLLHRYPEAIISRADPSRRNTGRTTETPRRDGNETAYGADPANSQVPFSATLPSRQRRRYSFTPGSGEYYNYDIEYARNEPDQSSSHQHSDRQHTSSRGKEKERDKHASRQSHHDSYRGSRPEALSPPPAEESSSAIPEPQYEGPPDYYEVLGISETATEREITKAWRKLCLRCHPDKVKESERDVAAERFKQIGQAHEVLSDPQRRAGYDTFRARSHQPFPTFQETQTQWPAQSSQTGAEYGHAAHAGDRMPPNNPNGTQNQHRQNENFRTKENDSGPAYRRDWWTINYYETSEEGYHMRDGHGAAAFPRGWKRFEPSRSMHSQYHPGRRNYPVKGWTVKRFDGTHYVYWYGGDEFESSFLPGLGDRFPDPERLIDPRDVYPRGYQRRPGRRGTL